LHLYEIALTHTSALSLSSKKFSISNERLEFLGDSVFNTIVSEYLYSNFPNENEGFLTNLRSKIVNRQILNEIAVSININKFLKYKINGNLSNSNIYGNALEAIIGAMFLDKGYEFTKNIIVNKILKQNIDLEYLIKNETNYKGEIIDFAQKFHYSIEFKDREVYLNDGKKGYRSELYLNNKLLGSGKGVSKKIAQQLAAKEALTNLKNQI
jgi:ribonuclease-3